MTKKYVLTDQHRAQLKPWADKWIANAMRTRGMDDDDRAAMRAAVKGLYEAANLTPPPDHRIVFVPSPFVLRFAGGFAAAIWHRRKKGVMREDEAIRDATAAATQTATDDGTYDATRAVTTAATDDATYVATAAATTAATGAATIGATSAAIDAATDAVTRAVTRAATEAATRDATEDATYGATAAATDAATRDATEDATYYATDGETYAATHCATHATKHRIITDLTRNFVVDIPVIIMVADAVGVSGFGLECARNAWNMWQSGNQWSAWASFLSFFRHIAKLPIDYSKWDHWEKGAIHAGPRIMHPDFCMISDFPEVLTVDAENRPHNETGPFCRWRDGSALYALRGVNVPAWVLETPRDQIDPNMVLAIENVDQRAEVIRHVGVERLFDKLQPRLLEEKAFGDNRYELYQVDIGFTVPRIYIKMQNPSEDKTHIECVHKDVRTVEQALNFRNFGEIRDGYEPPFALT